MALNVYSSLLYPFISVFPESRSINGVVVLNTPPFKDNVNAGITFGTVYGINMLATRVTVGQKVMFNSGEAVLVTQGGQLSYIADERLVIIIENPAS